VPPEPRREVQVRLPVTRPYVAYTILGITIAIFVLQSLSQRIFGVDVLAALGACEKPAILQGQLWRFITPVFLHANVPHIAFNMYALWVFGLDLERLFGHWRFLVLYLLAGFTGNVLSFLFLPNSPAGSVGASTAIFGLVAAEGVFLIQNRKLLGRNYGRAISNVVFIVIGNLVLGLSIPGIDNWGHAGGLLGGLLFTWLGGPVWEVQNVGMGVQLVDKREFSRVITAAAVVILVFGAIALWGMRSALAR